MVSIPISKIIFSKKILAIFLGLLVLSGVLWLSLRPIADQKIDKNKIEDNEIEIRPVGSLYTDSNLFLSAIKQNPATAINKPATGLIVPHHLLAIDLIAKAFAGVSARKFSQVVLLSPDHFNAGETNISVSENNFSTVFGELKSDTKVIEQLKKLPFVKEGDFFYREHGLQAIFPFIKYYFPETKVIAVTFKPSVTKAELDQLIKALEQTLTSDSLIVQSTDFSHYLSPDKASELDDISIKTLSSNNAEDILSLNQPENIDSVAAFYVQASLQKDFYHSSATIKDHKNSQEYTKEKVLSSTSYLSAIYSEPNKKAGDAEFIFVGDVMLSRYIGQLMDKRNDYNFPFEKIKPFLSKADLVFGNLESPISSSGKSTGNLYPFKADPRVVLGLKNAGFNVMSVANNHAFDYGLEAFSSTLNNLKGAGIAYAGGGENLTQASQGAFLELNGTKVTVLAYTDLLAKKLAATNSHGGFSYLDKDQMVKDIIQAKRKSDLVIVSFHWGREYEAIANERQKDIARVAVEAGASLIIGHHPHIAQELSKINNVSVAYSLGNFIFDQNFSPETKTGILLEVIIKGKRIASVNPLTVSFTSNFQPYLATK
ncbi:MAG: AmmeMemoRadiSam system protein B [Candidatus Falkowbacteria bacterium]|nr:AmmeMemoRadiSam system protein B [Candidatus Falkowbacteria bacterium]